ncbi:MAG: inositol monophosphatase/fructose-1,6-bisphosphatase family protein [Solidesulfovibrio magneticus str. Maddingley MBC34]|uniref:Inositol-1-monophosphatase n=1 Tax=Solidesulfovibrio magneticus str. Maddingley MBC34 TaxID=1206767 RepID=K6GK74_9BACT|nr:MAG: inositol monophosphatase/fructose-1,6-bisphosphatase family protein [Solidesulfovibrio magneticus str. Maddingley MBC34]
MTNTETARLMEAVRQAVLAAGERIRADWDAPRDVRLKGRIDLVTATDLAVEEGLKEALARVLPEAAFLAEETAAKTVLSGLTWIIDPVDGTTNFAHGFPFVCTSVALYDGQEPVIGCVNAPMLGQCFTAGKGLGAYCNGEPIRVSGTDRPEAALVATGFPYAIRENLDEIMADLRIMLAETQGIRRPGSAALDLAYVAAGRFDAFYELALNPWDVAAGALLVAEAGGRVGSYRPDGPYRLGDFRILATNGALHAPMLALLAD